MRTCGPGLSGHEEWHVQRPCGMNKFRKAKNTKEADVSGSEQVRQNYRKLRGSQESTTHKWSLAAR